MIRAFVPDCELRLASNGIRSASAAMQGTGSLALVFNTSSSAARVAFGRDYAIATPACAEVPAGTAQAFRLRGEDHVAVLFDDDYNEGAVHVARGNLTLGAL